MAELIYRDKCQERIFRFADRLTDWGYPEQAEAVRAVAKGIKLEKTVDAVEVVRCKDCKHYVWDEFDGCYVCIAIGRYVKPDFWCAYRERRTDG